MSLNKKVSCIVGAVIVFFAIAVVAGYIFQAHENRRLHITEVKCSIPENAVSENYSATIFATKNFDAISDNAKTLFTKDNGDLLSWSESLNQISTGPGQNDYASVTSTYIMGTIPVQEIQAFMSDVQNLGGSIQSPSYNETTHSQLVQNCTDDLNTIEEQEILAETYSKSFPTAFEHYVYNGNGTNSGTMDQTNSSNIDDINTQLQSIYGTINSNEDNIQSVLQGVNEASINLTIDDGNPPAVYYPPYGSAPVTENAN